MINKHTQGKRNRQSGAAWERKVREDLIKDGWFVSKFQSNVEDGKLIPAKGNRFFARTLGFPDYICWRQASGRVYYIRAVECKSNGYLSPIEKIKCKWLLENAVFPEILIAKKRRVGRNIIPEYIDFKEKYMGDIK